MSAGGMAGVDPTSEQRIPNRQLFAYGLGAWGKDFGCAIVFIYATFFMIQVARLDPAFVGSLMLFARIFDAFTDPAMGLVVANTRTRWGGFRPWILMGAAVNSLFIIALFTVPEGVNLQVYFTAMFILWGITYTMNDIPYWSMLPTLATGKRSREQVAVVPRFFAASAWWLLGTFGILFIDRFPSEREGYQKLAIIMAVLFVGLSAVTAVTVRSLAPPDPSAEKTSFKRMFKIIVKNDQLAAFLGCVVLFNLIIQTAGGMLLFYFTGAVGNDKFFALWQFAGGLSQMGALLAMPLLLARPGMRRRALYALASLLTIVGLLVLLLTRFIAGPSWLMITIVTAASIVFNVGVGFFLGLSTVMLADVVDYGEFKLGTRDESIVFAVQPMMVKFAAAFAGAFVGFGLDIVGYDAGLEAQSEATKAGMTFLTIGIPIIAAVLGWLIYQWKFKLNGVFHKEVMTSLAAQREVPGAGGYPG